MLHVKLTSLQELNSSGGPCPTCLFPSYPGINSIDVAAHRHMDFSNQWIYFLGDISIRQMYGKFAALVHRAQVRQACLNQCASTGSGARGNASLVPCCDDSQYLVLKEELTAALHIHPASG